MSTSAELILHCYDFKISTKNISFQPWLIIIYCRVDRINEAEFKSASNNKSSPAHQQAQHQHQQTSFLWTIGPRPFWELWPNKKHKKKRLSLEEFIQSLLEQWAKTHHYPLELASQTCLEKDQGPESTSSVSKALLLNNHKTENCKFYTTWCLPC